MLKIDPDLMELAGEYAADSGLSPLVCYAFLRVDREPPSRARIDRVGFTAAESRLIEPLLSSPEAL